VQIHRGPAAVIGDESHTQAIRAKQHLEAIHRDRARPFGEGVASRMIRKPEDLPVIAVLFRGASGLLGYRVRRWLDERRRRMYSAATC
jgi:hypothetical protein